MHRNEYVNERKQRNESQRKRWVQALHDVLNKPDYAMNRRTIAGQNRPPTMRLPAFEIRT